MEKRLEQKDACIDGQTHDWKYKGRRVPSTGIFQDSYWVDTYYCSKCLQKREESGYFRDQR